MDADHRVRDAFAHESAADGIPDLFVDQACGGVERLESHAIGVRGHALPLFEHHVTVVVEMDAFEAGEVQSIIQRADLADVHHVVGIHGGRQIAFEPSHRSTIGAVADWVSAREPYSVIFYTCGRTTKWSACNEEAKACAATIGTTVCEDEGPTPMVKHVKHTEHLAPSPLLVRHAGVTSVIPSRYRIPAERPESLSPCAMMAARVMPASDKSVSETVRRTS